jgi:predicted MFS family arabinose efflux permease
VTSVAGFVRLGLRLPAGVLIDRTNRRRLMLYCESLRALAMGVLAVAVAAGHAGLGLILVVAGVDGAGVALFSAAERAALRHVVLARQLPEAAARNEARTFTAELVGPSLGGVLFGVARALPFIVDAASFLVSFGAIAAIRRPLQEHTNQPREGWVRSLVEGWRFVVREPFLRTLIIALPVLNMAFGGVVFVMVVVLRHAGAPAAAIGFAQAVIAAGGLCGAVIAPRLQRAWPARRLVVGLSWVCVSMVAACALLPPGYWVVAPLPLVVLLAPAVSATLQAHQIAITPDRLLGRVVSVLAFLISVLSPLGPLVGGVVVQHANGHLAFAVFAGVLAVAAVVVSTSRGVRGMRPAR